METPRLVAPLLAALGAMALALAAVDRSDLRVGDHWPLLIVAALAFGVVSGILWERRTTTDLAGQVSQLKQQAAGQRAELAQARTLSSSLQSEAALALRDSEALYHSLVDHLPLSVLRKDREGEYTFVNRRYLEFSGKDAQEILGTT